MSRFSLLIVLLVTSCALTFARPVSPQQANGVSDKAVQRIVKEVRHELLMLPYLDVFDYLAYKVDGYNVTLLGQVTRGGDGEVPLGAVVLLHYRHIVLCARSQRQRADG